MTHLTRRAFISSVGAVAVAPRATALSKFSDCSFVMDIEAPLNVGTLRTPTFAVKKRNYYILLRMTASKLPTELTCLLGNSFTPWHKCSQESPLQGIWTVWDGAIKVAGGAFGGDQGEGETAEQRQIGAFQGRSKGSYVVEVTFKKDGGPLKALAPRLTVRTGYDFWCGPA